MFRFSSCLFAVKHGSWSTGAKKELPGKVRTRFSKSGRANVRQSMQKTKDYYHIQQQAHMLHGGVQRTLYSQRRLMDRSASAILGNNQHNSNQNKLADARRLLAVSEGLRKERRQQRNLWKTENLRSRNEYRRK